MGIGPITPGWQPDILPFKLQSQLVYVSISLSHFIVYINYLYWGEDMNKVIFYICRCHIHNKLY